MDFNTICQYRVGQLPYFVERLRDTLEGDASLLDKTAIIWGSPMADLNLHNHRRCRWSCSARPTVTSPQPAPEGGGRDADGERAG